MTHCNACSAIADDVTPRITALLWEAENAMNQAVYESSHVVREDRYRDVNPSPDAPPEVREAMRKAVQACEEARKSAVRWQLNRDYGRI